MHEESTGVPELCGNCYSGKSAYGVLKTEYLFIGSVLMGGCNVAE
jgi:hypothetical protein